MEINGIAHIVLTVSQFEDCVAFYKGLLPPLGLSLVFDGDDFCYHVGGRTGLGLSRAEEPFAEQRFDQRRVGLHHICFRARSEADVDEAHVLVSRLVAEHGGLIDAPPNVGPWAPGYYFFVFEDPVGTRLEINFVPGAGVFAEDAEFDPGQHYR
ncbi:MAG: VOC family protein [Pseudomonadota bacterium]